MEFEVVELVYDLFTGLAHEEFGVLDDGSVYFFEGKAVGNFAKVVKQPLPKAQVFGVDIPRSPWRL